MQKGITPQELIGIFLRVRSAHRGSNRDERCGGSIFQIKHGINK
jgi:hypothetical protein